MLFWHLSLSGAQLCGGQGGYKIGIGKRITQMKHNTITRLCSLAAAAVLAVSCIALTGCGSSASSAASSTASTAASAAAAGDNSCGENVTWTLADGTLTISGTGRMTDYSSNSPAPWADQADQITAVVVEAGVTTVGGSSFKGCTNLTTVTLADGVEYIETAAFNGCTALSDITIPESVGYIKTGAFKDCNALTSVTVRSNCRIDMNVFPSTVEINRYAD